MIAKNSSKKWAKTRNGNLPIDRPQVAKIEFYPRSDKENAYFAVFSINDQTIEISSRSQLNDVLCEFMNESDIIFSPF